MSYCANKVSQSVSQSNFDDICYTTIDLELGDSQMTKYKNFKKNSRWL